MRVLTICFLLVGLSGAVGLSSQELHRRYGDPDMERFVARPGIGVTVEYGFDRLACEVSTETPLSLAQPQAQRPLMPSKEVSDVIEELAPTSARGEKINQWITRRGSIAIEDTDYQNISIVRTTQPDGPSNQNQDIGTLITFKRESCPGQVQRPMPGR